MENEITKNKNSLVGLAARLTKKQTNRVYFSDIPVGTLFIILEQYPNDRFPSYDLLGYFLNYKPQVLSNGLLHFTGYIEKGTWQIVDAYETIEELINFNKK